ncbi:MAG TPA: lysylphosphatidylglycerol synthase domain-containing protein [Sandaracinaceae bacterium LLY-WYZ-13_1]|nr:lysylphosphatidylglycerol synthase domain-containing protein [Sandaracinaceae bacterium LLY-WYZ-13_1]
MADEPEQSESEPPAEHVPAHERVSVVDVEGPEGEAKRRRRDRLKTIGRWLLLVLGVGAVVWLVFDVGPDAVWTALVGAGVFLPFVMLFEIGFVGMDVVSLRLMYGARARSVPGRVWLRSAMMAYGIMILLPAGRAGGEVMRAANLAPYIGGPRAAAGAALLQGVTLWGNTLISIPCYAAVAYASGPTSVLALLVAGNGLVTGVMGSAILFGARFSRVGGWLGRRIGALAAHGSHFDESLRDMPALPIGPIGAAFLGRISQFVQYAIILVAVGGALTLVNALCAQAIHLVGAGLGDMVPNQVGVTEGAYRIFVDYLPLSEAEAIAIALVHRICQFTLAGTSLAVGALWKPGEVARAEAHPHATLAGSTTGSRDVA